jgi:hypothetical protein
MSATQAKRDSLKKQKPGNQNKNRSEAKSNQEETNSLEPVKNST